MIRPGKGITLHMYTHTYLKFQWTEDERGIEGILHGTVSYSSIVISQSNSVIRECTRIEYSKLRVVYSCARFAKQFKQSN